MLDEDHYIRLIDFGESVIVDNYEQDRVSIVAPNKNNNRRASV